MAGFTMTKLKELKELRELKESQFGRPHPRHGLKLLYWFANECLYFNNKNKMCWIYNPKSGQFGFQQFKNRKDKNGVKLLPDGKIYYEVGNLNNAEADQLQDYVREDYSHRPDRSNMDRIIVSIGKSWFDQIYVTQHSDRSEFDRYATYCISKKLIRDIRDLTREQFLQQTGYYQENTEENVLEDDEEDEVSYNYESERLITEKPTRKYQTHTPKREEQCCGCTIL